MREVTLYTAQAQTVMAGDRVEMYETVMPYMGDVSITGVSQSAECLFTEKLIELPVIHMRNDNGEQVTDEFVAVDLTLMRLIQCYKDGQDRAEARAFQARVRADGVQEELDKIKGSSFWRRVKWAFCGVHL